MKLLTHNMLMSPGTRNGFPLAIQVQKMEEVEAEVNFDFIVRMVEKIDYAALLATVASVRSRCIFGTMHAHMCVHASLMCVCLLSARSWSPRPGSLR